MSPSGSAHPALPDSAAEPELVEVRPVIVGDQPRHDSSFEVQRATTELADPDHPAHTTARALIRNGQ
jgi:hypothetical protein